jgi:hypothetical protein
VYHIASLEATADTFHLQRRDEEKRTLNFYVLAQDQTFRSAIHITRLWDRKYLILK